jgi:seryl-tRNA synthetase
LEIDGKTLGKLHHHEIMNLIDMVDLERGTKVAGHRGFFLKGVGVLLNQALINFGI